MWFEEAIVVSGNLRCYSPYCTEEDYPELLQDFAIQLMQERANEEGGTTAWICSGEEETKGHYDGLGDYQTQSLNSAANLQLARVALKPSVEAEKLFGLIPFNLKAQVVTFSISTDAAGELESAWTTSSGELFEKSLGALCNDETAEVIDIPYRIDKYPVCLGDFCESLSDADVAALPTFVSNMKTLAAFDSKVSCKMSGAFGPLSTKAVALLVTASLTVWQLL
jgi:hypothetical protein